MVGLGATWAWTATYGTMSDITLNDSTVWPRYELRRIVGLGDAWEYEDNTAQKTEEAGEIWYPNFARGKTVTFEGDTVGRTMEEMEDARGALFSAFVASDGVQGIGTMTGTPYTADHGDAMSFSARVMTLTQDDEITKGPSAVYPWTRAFIIGLRVSAG